MSVEADLRSIIMKKAPEGTEFSLDSKLVEIGLDSLDVIEIVFEIEDKYGVQLPQNDEEAASATFRDLCDLVQRVVAEKAGDGAPQAAG
jgi:acyl carrier protein